MVLVCLIIVTEMSRPKQFGIRHTTSLLFREKTIDKHQETKSFRV